MPNFLRLLLGLAMVPACWGVSRAAFDSLIALTGTDGWLSPEAIAFCGGLAAFVLCWMTVSHPVRTYVLGHELTHALWGLAFGALPSNLHVGESGGSVRLTKSNMLITLAPYFFPFYTFVVIVVALITSAFVRPLPWLPLWMFMIGFTWAFHVLFTLETLTQRQPDVALYGRVFSWTLIYLANVLLVLLWLALTTRLTFSQLGGFLGHRLSDTYVGLWAAACWCVGAFRNLFGSGGNG